MFTKAAVLPALFAGLFVSGCIGVAGTRLSRIQTWRPNPNLNHSLDKIFAQRVKEITTEASRPSSADWAGEYYNGDGLGYNASLSLAPVAGFLYTFRTCSGLEDRNFGTVTSSAIGPVLHYALPVWSEGQMGRA